MEYALTAVAGVAVYGRRVLTALSVRLGLLAQPGLELEGRRLRISLDVGRERGTWMPPAWALSGRRLCFDIAVQLAAGGVCLPVAVGAYADARFGEGRWAVDGDTLRFDLPLLAPVNRGDVTLPAERVFFKTRAWQGVVSSRGNLLLLQRRFVVRREFRTIGVFRCAELDEGEVSGQLTAARVRQRFTE